MLQIYDMVPTALLPL